MLCFHKVLVSHMMDHINIGTVGKKVSDPVAIIFQKSQGLIGLEIDHADGIIVGLPGPCLHLQSFPHAVIKAFLIGHGLSKEKALHLFTAPVLQKFNCSLVSTPSARLRVPMPLSMEMMELIIFRALSLELPRKAISIFSTSKK